MKMKPEEYPTSHALAKQMLEMPDLIAVLPVPESGGAMRALPVDCWQTKIGDRDVIVLQPPRGSVVPQASAPMKLRVEITAEFANSGISDEDIPTLVEEAMGLAIQSLPGSRPGFKVRVVPTRAACCANCGTVHNQQDLLPLAQAPGLAERLTPGDEVPAGECSACRAFCYFIE